MQRISAGVNDHEKRKTNERGDSMKKVACSLFLSHRELAVSILFWLTVSLLACPLEVFASGAVYNSVIQRAEIMEYGLYEADRLGRIEGAETSMGSLAVANKESVRLIDKTTRIPAEIGRHFGIGHVIHGEPHNARVKYTIKVFTPGLKKPPDPGPQLYSPQDVRIPKEQSSTTTQNLEQWSSYANLNKPAYDFFVFEHEWELVPGTWTFQVWYRDEMLAEQSFDIYSVPKNELNPNVSPTVRKVVEYMSSPECNDCLRAVYMVKVLGNEAAAATPYLIKNLYNYSTDSQTAFDCGCAKETPAALASIGEPAIAPLIESLSSNIWTVREGAMKSILLMGKTAIDPIITAARNGRNLDTRRHAVVLLGEFKENAIIVPPLIYLFKNDYFPEIRYAALESLQKLKDPSSISALEEVLDKEMEIGIRAKTAEVLGSFKDERCLNMLIKVYRKKDEERAVREAALIALALNHNPQKVSPIIKETMQQLVPYEKISILQAISESNNKTYIGILVQSLKDVDMRVREAAMEALIKNKASGEVLKTELSSGNNNFRIPALIELSRRGEPFALKLLPELLVDRKLNNRLDAALILAKKRDSRAFETLMQIARLNEHGSAGLAIRGLGMLGDKRALGFIQESTSHQNSYIVQAALEALGEMSYPGSISHLIKYIAEEPPARTDYTYLARNSLIKLGEQSVAALIDALKVSRGRQLNRVSNEFNNVVQGVGRKSIPYLADAIKFPVIYVKQSAAEALSLFKNAEAASILVSVLSDKKLQRDVQSYLIRIGAPAVKSVLPLLKAKDPNVKLSAAIILGTLGEKSALKPLLKALKDERIRRSAIEPLGGIKHTRAINALIKLLKNDDKYVRRAATQALGTIGHKQAVQPLLELFGREEDHNQRVCILEALGKIGDNRAMPIILAFLHDERSQSRITATEALLRIASPSSAVALLETLTDKESIVRDNSYKALKKITGVDCGLYPDAWRLWMDRNKLPQTVEHEEERTSFFQQILDFISDIFWNIWMWF
jgi:HEAT repeat protein